MDEGEDVRKCVDDALKLMDFDLKKYATYRRLNGRRTEAQGSDRGRAGDETAYPDSDEPIAGPDPHRQEQFMQPSCAGSPRRAMTIARDFCTIWMDSLADYATRIIAMDHGAVYMDGTPWKSLRISKAPGCRLDASEARQGGHLLKQCGWDIPDDIITRDELVDFIGQHIIKRTAR